MPQAEKDNQRPAVCIVRQNYYPDGHVRRDAETLARAGYDVSIVALRRPGQLGRELLNGVRIYRLPIEHHRDGLLRYLWEYASFFLLALLTVTALHLRKHFRVVEVDNMPDLLVFSALVPKLTGSRVIFYIFDNMPELVQVTRNLQQGQLLVRLLIFCERLAARFADRVVVTQETARRVMQARAVRPDKLLVVLNCPDEAIFEVRAPRERTHGARALEIVTHGAILERYGIQVLIDALPAIAAEVPSVRVQIFGEGEYRVELEARARQKGVSEQVQFRGFVPLDELIAGLSQADIGYVGMLCDLMLSNKLMEYVALGVPVALARWPTFEHYFPDDAVTYFRPGSPEDLAASILSVYREPGRARERAQRAAELYRLYRWPVQQERYLRLYADLLASGKTRESGQAFRSTV